MTNTRRMLLEFEIEEVGLLAKRDNKVRKDLLKAFSDLSDVVRERALLAAIDLNDPTIVDNISKVLTEDNEADVRVAAAQALAWFRQPRTIPVLLSGLKDPNTWVRSHCARALSQLLPGPIWARVPEEKVDMILADFPDMIEEEIRIELTELKFQTDSIDRFMKWRREEFEIEIDDRVLVEELEGTPIILGGSSGMEEVELPPVEVEPKTPGVSEEVSLILSELPEEIRNSLPDEDLRRLTPKTARELVDSLMLSYSKPKKVEPRLEPKKKKKKKVKVRKVTRVKKARKGPTRKELIDSLPDEVKESVPEETLKELSTDELEALVSTSVSEETEDSDFELSDLTGVGPATQKKLEDAGYGTIAELAKARPEKLSDAVSGVSVESAEDLISQSKALLSDVEETPEMETDTGEVPDRLTLLTRKYGEEKANLLINIPPDMLEGIPDEQIETMDVETLRGLTDALGSS